MKRKLMFVVSLLLVILVFCGCTAAGPRSVSGTVVKVSTEEYLVLLERRGSCLLYTSDAADDS